MAENDLSIKLLIEAEDKSRSVLEQARQNTRALVQQQKDLWKQISDADNAEITGNKNKALSAEEYFKSRTKVMGLSGEIDKSYRKEESALRDLTQKQKDHAEGVEKSNKQKVKSTDEVSGALGRYVKHFASVAAVEEVIRRSIQEYSAWERGMARIELQTGATSQQLEHLGHTFHNMSRLTGIGVQELQQNFMTFQSGVGQMGTEVENAFEDIVKASHAAGVSVDVMGRTAVAAIKTMNVPYSELKGMLDVVVDEIPASAMQAWDAVGPKILGVMRGLGSTGKDSVTQAASAFAGLVHVLGNAQEAGSVHLEMMKKATDQSSFFGKIMTPALADMSKSGATATETYEAFYQQMDRLGVFDEDPSRALAMQQRYGFSDSMIRGIEEGHKLHERIAREAEHTGKSTAEIEKNIMRLNRGPKAAVDDLLGSFSELLTALGKFLGPSIPDTLSKYVQGMTKDIQYLEFLLEKFREKTGSRTKEERDEQGNIVKSAEEKPYNFDPGGWFAQLVTGKSREEQLEADKGKKGLAWSKMGYGITDFWLHDVFGLPEMPEKKEGSGPTQPTTGPGRRRATPDKGGRPGYAIGGEFEVKGTGGTDSQPVEFMATPGERVAVTTPMQESLQVQQDKADQAARDHFARFRTSAFTKQVKPDWWRHEGMGRLGGGGPGGAGGGGGAVPDQYRPGGDGHRPGHDHNGVDNSAAVPTTKVPTNADPNSPDGPAEDVATAIKRGYLKPNVTGEGQRNYEGGTDKQKVAQIIANQLRSQGYKEHVIAGILANVNSESRFDPTNSHFDQPNPKFRGTEAQNSHGLFQEGGDEYNLWMKWMDKKGYPRDQWKDPRIQAEWIGDRLKEPQYAKLKKKLDESTTKEQAAVAFVQDYLKPADRYRNQRTAEYSRGVPDVDKWTGGTGTEAAPPSADGSPTFKRMTVADMRAALEGKDPAATGDVAEGSGAGVIKMLNKGAIRDKPLSAETRAYLEYASLKTGLEVHVGSGGQDVHGKRTGSHRHDLGGAADYKLWDPAKNNGKGGYLDFSNPQDKARMAEFVKNSAKAGATGQGAGRGYMGTQTIHTGGGSEATWGAEGKGGFVSEAHAAGRKERLTKEQLRVEVAALKEQKETRLAAAAAEKEKARLAAAAPPAKVAAAEPEPEPRQAGGLARAGKSYLVGEGGAELFKPNMPGNIFPHGMMPPGGHIPQLPGTESLLSGGFDFTNALAQYRELAAEISKPLNAAVEMPRAGPMRQRMSRRVEAQRERDVGRMTRFASHSDIGMS